jgi:hypothetical protein
MARYGGVFKERAVARLLPPESSPVETVSREIGVSAETLERWRAQALSQPAGQRIRAASVPPGGGDPHSLHGRGREVCSGEVAADTDLSDSRPALSLRGMYPRVECKGLMLSLAPVRRDHAQTMRVAIACFTISQVSRRPAALRTGLIVHFFATPASVCVSMPEENSEAAS